MQEKEKIAKALAFVEHIEKHLEFMFGKDNAEVMCKICGKTIDEIYEEATKLVKSEHK